MTASDSTTKRRRAAQFAVRPGPAPAAGVLDVTWASPFDQSCFVVSVPEVKAKARKPVDELMKELTAETGCTEEEILAHGRKVRALLFFAEERLAREGVLATLEPKQKVPFELKPVTPAF
ncbi:MAG: hypothetical protein IPI38_09540 [Gemmatimonadetes bacterium]|jgi:hypothetical protein|nr:hypothetical protein [Gemmatimonadota bacterium]MBP6669855.1 hypothetical protein [Gemmatimonadales bacterium]MBK6781607.1 hypothetical protein [Gemmatimonadota bacterium]MBK7350036.1 hypothetical protein [Gemmatimonadota bacterium]MBK7715652.1 hypothetical protein [Gemmatimonadota bacterium]